MFAVDDYNALYGATEYGRHVRSTDERGNTTVSRVPLTVSQLRLVRWIAGCYDALLL
jgi:hypothetical protein